MTELEIVLLCAFAFMVHMYMKANHMAKYYRCAILAIGLNQATVTVNENEKTFTIDVDMEGLKDRIS
jgi:hypothetical protein